MPTSSSLVTNLPADFNTFGQAVDTSMSELLGGTTGQVLSKTSNTNMDFTWVTPTDQTPLTTKGDLFTFTTVDARLGVGTDGQVLTASSAAATGLSWTTPTAGMTNPMTTTGDTIYSSSGSTPARLGIGTTGQVLTVASGVPSWATPASAASGLTLITRNTFTNVASVTIDSIFSSTYKSYMVVVEKVYAATYSDDFQMQLRYGSTTGTTEYYGASGYAAYNSASFANIQVNAATSFTLMQNTGNTSGAGNSATLFFTHVGNTSEAPTWSGTAIDYMDNRAHFIGGLNGTAQTYTGLVFKTSSSNISGTVAVYGMAAA